MESGIRWQLSRRAFRYRKVVRYQLFSKPQFTMLAGAFLFSDAIFMSGAIVALLAILHFRFMLK